VTAAFEFHWEGRTDGVRIYSMIEPPDRQTRQNTSGHTLRGEGQNKVLSQPRSRPGGSLCRDFAEETLALSGFIGGGRRRRRVSRHIGCVWVGPFRNWRPGPAECAQRRRPDGGTTAEVREDSGYEPNPHPTPVCSGRLKEDPRRLHRRRRPNCTARAPRAAAFGPKPLPDYRSSLEGQS